jgi:hypothetical protein
MNDVPGYKVRCSARSSGSPCARATSARSSAPAFKSLAGGELKGMTKNLQTSREEVVGRMVAEAEARGATPCWPCASTLGDGRQLDRRSAPTARRSSSSRSGEPGGGRRHGSRACLLPPAGVAHPGVVHAPGRAVAPRVPGGPGCRDPSSPPSATPPGRRADAAAGPPLRGGRRHPLLRHRGPVHAIGFGVDVEPGRGPVVAEPFRSAADLARLRPLEPALDTSPTSSRRSAWWPGSSPGSGVALIGFAGAPSPWPAT